LGFHLQRISLSGSEDDLTAPLPSMPFAEVSNETGEPESPTHRWGSEDLRTRQVRFDELGFTRGFIDRSSPSVAPLRGIHPSGLDTMSPRHLLSWAFTLR
jgi:hypothetical protein